MNSSSHFEPLVEPLAGPPDREAVFVRLARRPHCLFLDSAMADGHLGRYSFVTCDPFAVLRNLSGGGDALVPLLVEQRDNPTLKPNPTQKQSPERKRAGKIQQKRNAPGAIRPTPLRSGFGFELQSGFGLETLLAKYRTATVDGLPPFQGGAAGLFSYELGRRFEQLPCPRFDEFGMPAMTVGLYDVVIAFDHQTDRAWIISQGLPETEPAARRRRAANRLAQFHEWLEGISKPHNGCLGHSVAVAQDSRAGNNTQPPLAPDQLAPQFPVDGHKRLTSNFSESAFLSCVQRAIEYIHAGDVFQVNVAQRLLHPALDDSVSLYLRLRQCNPAPFAGYFDLGDFQVVSASPERFMKVSDRLVETRPIKGTRPRSTDEKIDRLARDELCRSEKDRAENVMIVDLLRNDLSRVCKMDSVRVRNLCRLETYQHVHHLVSVVDGHLADGRGPLDLVRAAFPGGSVTGAPKVRAMEIIAELEPTARGAYCGSLGYLGFDGSMDLNILIRTITAGRGWWQAPVGGGIVAQSDPRREYEETWHKAEGLVEAMKGEG